MRLVFKSHLVTKGDGHGSDEYAKEKLQLPQSVFVKEKEGECIDNGD